MKIQPARADGFIAKPDAKVRAVLIYGPDTGLARERLNALTRAVAGAVDDPFRVSEFSADVLKEDPARLRDEAASMALTGGRRVVRIRDAGDAQGSVFAEWLEDAIGDALVIVTASDLNARSKLRLAFEESDSAAAVACYADDDEAVGRVVRETLKAAGLAVSADALDWLTDHLGGDRELSRRELEKLVTYMGPGPSGRTVSEDDVLACVGDTAAFDLDGLIFAMADGDQAVMQRTFARLTAEGSSAIGILTAAARHLVRLHEVRGKLADGRGLESAMMSLRPPVFFKFKNRFQAQANRWSEALLARGLSVLTEAELAAKSTDMPAEAITERALIQIAQAARGASRPR
jgi:DNA polymerase-3 subunit delta